MTIRIAIGSDHRGAEVLPRITLDLQTEGCKVLELGVCTDRICDYPDVAFPVAVAVADGDADRGVLICGSGIGMSIAANKVRGIRAALVHDEVGAEMSRRHNDANVLCLPADLLGPRIIERIIHTWVRTEFEGGRHARRVEKIAAIEAGRSPETIASTGIFDGDTSRSASD